MNHSFIDRYAYLDSPIHGAPTGLKVQLTLGLLSLLLIGIPMLQVEQRGWTLGVYGFILIAMAMVSHIPLSYLLSRSALVLPFSGLIIIVNFFSGNFSLAQMSFTLFKSLLSVFTLLLLTSTTPFHEILKQLSRWRAPRLLIITLAFMYRYFFLLLQETEALRRAILLRHTSVKGWDRITVHANIIGMLLIRSFERAERVYDAMRMRGFTGDLQ